MVFQTRHPSWIILCYIWLLRFAHTGEAQAAKEGKVMGKQSLFWLIYLAVYLHEPARPRGCRPRLRRGATLPRQLPAPSPLGLRAGLLWAAFRLLPGAVRPTGAGFLAGAVRRAWAAAQSGGGGVGRWVGGGGPRRGSALPPLGARLRRGKLRPELVGDWGVQILASWPARRRAAGVPSLPRGECDLCELRTLGLLMKCSLRRRRRRGPAVGARPPARNNNAAEVKRGSGARPAAGMSPCSARRARGPAAAWTRPEPIGLGRAGEAGAGWGWATDTKMPPGRLEDPPNICRAVESEWSDLARDLDPEA